MKRPSATHAMVLAMAIIGGALALSSPAGAEVARRCALPAAGQPIEVANPASQDLDPAAV